MMSAKIPSPAESIETAVFWQRANAGEFALPQCSACGKYHWYPRAICPFCCSDQIALKPAKGTGTIYSFSVSRRGKDDSYVIAYVTLDEGVTMMTNIVNADASKLAIGQRVRVTMLASEDGQKVPMFEVV
jgi:uncharacterized OB-fold protein